MEGNDHIPWCRSGYREERDWSVENRHLRNVAEFSDVNVGDSQRDAKVSSPPMPEGVSSHWTKPPELGESEGP